MSIQRLSSPPSWAAESGAAATSARPPLVLLADDDEWSARGFESILGPGGFAVLRYASGQQLLEQLAWVSPDLVLIRDTLPDGGGVDLVRQATRSGRLAEGTPVFVTAAAPMQRTERLDALRAGAWDVLHPPLDGEELLARLGNVVRAKLDADRARAAGLVDPATELYSVQGLLRRLRELAYGAARHHAPLACVVLAPTEPGADAEAPEPAAEARLGVLARLVAGAVRRSDVVGRVSRTEVAVLAPDTGRSGAEALARRLTARARAAPASLPRVHAGCQAVARVEESLADPVELLVQATMALRRAHADAGAPEVAFFDGDAPMR